MSHTQDGIAFDWWIGLSSSVRIELANRYFSKAPVEVTGSEITKMYNSQGSGINNISENKKKYRYDSSTDVINELLDVINEIKNTTARFTFSTKITDKMNSAEDRAKNFLSQIKKA